MHKAFVAEASLAGKLNHPHIVDIFDAVVEPDRSYLVMEYVPGTTLEAHVEPATLLPLPKVVEIVFKCVRALEYACRHGVIHRDIKPGNILLSESGETKVGDFGASFQQKMLDTTQISAVGSPAVPPRQGCVRPCPTSRRAPCTRRRWSWWSTTRSPCARSPGACWSARGTAC
jgi:serine/threonine protein kinase